MVEVDGWRLEEDGVGRQSFVTERLVSVDVTVLVMVAGMVSMPGQVCECYSGIAEGWDGDMVDERVAAWMAV